MAGLKENIYKQAPLWMQNLMISAYGIYWKRHRYGKHFFKSLPEFIEREKYNPAQWGEWQTERLRKLLIHAFDTVPFYHEKYSTAGLTRKDLKNLTLEDLPRLPFLEKDELRKFGTTGLLSSKREKGTFLSSSGSTGTPVRIYFTKRFHQTWNAAYEARVRRWASVNYKMSRAMIGGRRIIPDAHAKPPYYRYNYVEKQVYFSAYHLSPGTVDNYVEGLWKHRPEYLVGYAMSIYLWAGYISDKSLKTPPLKAVLTSSEKLTPPMRRTIEEAFGTKVYDAYSGVEACGLISENRYGELLFSPDTGILEVLDENGRQVSPGETGEVVLTGLLNFDQPLIRYRIGDRVTLAADQASKAGVHMPVIEEIEGRIEDVVTGPDGRQMVRFHALTYDLPGIKALQLVQHALDNFELRILKDDDYPPENEQIIKKRLFSQLGPVKVRFIYPDELEQTANGKIKAVISKLKK